MKDFRVVLVLILLISCSPQRRLERLLVHHPELRVADTLHIRDTFIQPTISAETVFLISRLADTLKLSRERLEVILARQRDTLYLKGTCKADTTIRTLHIPVEKIKYIQQKHENNLPTKIFLAILVLILLILSTTLLLKTLKP